MHMYDHYLNILMYIWTRVLVWQKEEMQVVYLHSKCLFTDNPYLIMCKVQCVYWCMSFPCVDTFVCLLYYCSVINYCIVIIN